MEEIKIECCECDADMTEAVLDACRETKRVGHFFQVGQVEETATTVELACPNGHECAYFCPAVAATAS